MTRDNLKLLRQWTRRPEEAFVRNLRLRALPSPNRALACRVAAKMLAPRESPRRLFVTGKHPRAVLPGLERVLCQPAGDRRGRRLGDPALDDQPL